MVDVRDLADLHVVVLTDPRGMGGRWIASADFLWLADVAALLKDRYGDAAAKVPTRVMPDMLVRLMYLFNAEIRPLTPNLGKRQELSASKAETILGWRSRLAREAVITTAESVLHGIGSRL